MDIGATVIRDVSGLTARDVAHKRVLCPGCGVKVFAMWPEGWDSHAAHRCTGLAERGLAARKAEFKSRYRHLFV